MPFEDVIGVWLNPDIDITADVSAYIKWAGHGDPQDWRLARVPQARARRWPAQGARPPPDLGGEAVQVLAGTAFTVAALRAWISLVVHSHRLLVCRALLGEAVAE